MNLWGFLGGSVVKNPPANAGDVRDMGLIPGLGRSPGGGHGNPLQYSCLKNPVDRGAWLATVPGVPRVGHNLVTKPPPPPPSPWSPTNWHLPSTSTRVTSGSAAPANLQHPWKELRVESRSKALCALKKLAGQVFR